MPHATSPTTSREPALDRRLGLDVPAAAAAAGPSGSGRPLLPGGSDAGFDADRAADDGAHRRPPARDVSAHARAAAADAPRRGGRHRRSTPRSPTRCARSAGASSSAASTRGCRRSASTMRSTTSSSACTSTTRCRRWCARTRWSSSIPAASAACASIPRMPDSAEFTAVPLLQLSAVRHRQDGIGRQAESRGLERASWR